MKKWKIPLIVLLVFILLGVGVKIYFDSQLTYSDEDVDVDALLQSEPLSKKQEEMLLEDQAKRVASLPEHKVLDASERNQYQLNFAISSFDLADDDQNFILYGTKNTYTLVTLHETVSYMNRYDIALEEISLRDYAQAWVNRSRLISSKTEKLFPTDTEISNIMILDSGEQADYSRDEADDSIIYIKLPKKLAPGEQITFAFDFTFPVCNTGMRADITGLGGHLITIANCCPIVSEMKDGKWVNNPVVDDGEPFYSSIGDYHAYVSAPSTWDVISTGDEMLKEKDSDYSTWELSSSSTRDFILASFDGLQKAEGYTENGILVQAWVPEIEEIPESAGKIIVDTAVTCLESFSETFGPYAYDSMDVLVCSFGTYLPGVAGMEYPQLVLISDYVVENIWENEKDYDTEQLEEVVSHEIGHNWFYGMVGSDSYNETWLDESMTAYTEQVYKEAISEFNGTEKILESNAMTYIKEYDGFIDLPADEFGEDYAAAAYQTGRSFLIQLRLAMGDEAFYKMMQEYVATYRMKIATTQGFVEILKPYIEGNEEAQNICKKYLKTMN
ncbi:MAG: M1 family aminopeptidase [Eubacteriales bacterium]|nr:M1 family aminopeptidase [Eubacteriales bacterium]